MKKAFILLFLLSLIEPITIEAKKKPFGNNLYWELNDNGVLTISGNGKMQDYGNINFKSKIINVNRKKYEKRPWHKLSKDIKRVIIEYGVTTIGDRAFYDCVNLESVEIANSVMSIGEWAFYRCNLKNIDIPHSVTSIGGVAFGQCENMTTIELPNSITEIGSVCFSGCISLKSITFPLSLGKISNNMFDGCRSLVSVIIPHSVTTIEERVFVGCENLKELNIPQSVTTIKDQAFAQACEINEKYKWVVKKAFSGTILSMPQFVLDGNPMKWGLTEESVNAYKYGICDDNGVLILAGKKGWKVTTLQLEDSSLYQVEENRKVGLVDNSGTWVIPLDKEYMLIESAGGNYIRVRDKNYKYGIITANGKEVIPPSRGYSSIGNYDKNTKLFSVTKGRYNGSCDMRGRELSMTKRPPTEYDIKADGGYSSVVVIMNGSAKYYKVSKNGRYGLTNAEGEEIVPPELDALEECGKGFLRFKVGDYWGVMNYMGKVTIPTDRGYTKIGNYVSLTKRFPYTMAGYKGECDATGRQISKIKVETPRQSTSVASSKSSSSSSSSPSSSGKSNSGNNTTTIHVEHHRDPVPVQEWVQCTVCWGSGNCPDCAGSGTRYVGDNLRRCWRCGGRGRCSSCSGQGGRNYTVYK